MKFSRFDDKKTTLPIEKQREILTALERRRLVKDLPGNQKAKLRSVK